MRAGLKISLLVASQKMKEGEVEVSRRGKQARSNGVPAQGVVKKWVNKGSSLSNVRRRILKG